MENLAVSTVATPPSPATTGTSLVVAAGEGSRFTAPFFATAHPVGELPSPANAEIVEVTAISTDTFTITRAQRGSTAKSIDTDWIIFNGIYKEDFDSKLDTSYLIMGEVPSGSIDSSNTTFTTANPYESGKLIVWVNGLLQVPTTHVTETTPASGVFTLDTAPTTGDNVVVAYVRSS